MSINEIGLIKASTAGLATAGAILGKTLGYAPVLAAAGALIGGGLGYSSVEDEKERIKRSIVYGLLGAASGGLGGAYMEYLRDKD